MPCCYMGRCTCLRACITLYTLHKTRKFMEIWTCSVPQNSKNFMYTDGPVPALFNSAHQYLQYRTKLFTLKLDQANSHVYIQGKVATGRNVIVENKEVFLVYSTSAQQEFFFEYPTSSSIFGIYVGNDTTLLFP